MTETRWPAESRDRKANPNPGRRARVTRTAERESMKARKVVVTVEIMTDKTIKELKGFYSYACDDDGVIQVQVNVIKDKKKK